MNVKIKLWIIRTITTTKFTHIKVWLNGLKLAKLTQIGLVIGGRRRWWKNDFLNASVTSGVPQESVLGLLWLAKRYVNVEE